MAALQRTTEKQVRLFKSCLASSSCILWHRDSIEFSCEQDPQTSLCPPRSTPTVSCLHLYNLASGQISMTPSKCTLSISSRRAVSPRSSGRYPPRILLLLSRFDHISAFPKLAQVLTSVKAFPDSLRGKVAFWVLLNCCCTTPFVDISDQPAIPQCVSFCHCALVLRVVRLILRGRDVIPYYSIYSGSGFRKGGVSDRSHPCPIFRQWDLYLLLSVVLPMLTPTMCRYMHTYMYTFTYIYKYI